MIKIFKSLFGQSEGSTTRDLQTINDLHVRDMIVLKDSFSLPTDLRGETMEITDVSTYSYGGENSSEWTIKGKSSEAYFLTYDPNDGDSIITISRKLKRKQFSLIFGSETYQSAIAHTNQETLGAQHTPDDLEGWLATSYELNEEGKGVFYSKDLRLDDTPSGHGERFTFKEFVSDDEQFLVECEIWGKNEIDVMLTIVIDEHDVAELWPGSVN